MKATVARSLWPAAAATASAHRPPGPGTRLRRRASAAGGGRPGSVPVSDHQAHHSGHQEAKDERDAEVDWQDRPDRGVWEDRPRVRDRDLFGLAHPDLDRRCDCGEDGGRCRGPDRGQGRSVPPTGGQSTRREHDDQREEGAEDHRAGPSVDPGDREVIRCSAARRQRHRVERRRGRRVEISDRSSRAASR